MKQAFAPLARQKLSDRLARQIRGSIQSGDFHGGERLPPILEMARRFGVGHPTIREALKKLEAMGVVNIRHGAGVFVARSDGTVAESTGQESARRRKLLRDLVQARMSLEVQAVTDAVHTASAVQLTELRQLLADARDTLADDERLNVSNMRFHRGIARCSGNAVLEQLLGTLYDAFSNEQRTILDIAGNRERDLAEHHGILDAIERRDEALAAERMRAHLEGVLGMIARWDANGPATQ